MKQRLLDLANTCYRNGHYTFTHFLSGADLDEFYCLQKEMDYVGTTLYGGSEFAERQMVRFGDEETLGYTEEFPICCLHCKPAAPKFAEKTGHRDVLGALMNLGIERGVIRAVRCACVQGLSFVPKPVHSFVSGEENICQRQIV